MQRRDMLDTMTVTKAGGALCGAFLVFLLGKWAAESIYHVGPSAAHGEEEIAQAYSIDTGASEEPAEEGAEAVPLADLMATADPAAGEKVFGKCKSCHKVDGANGTGPHLNGVVDRAVGSVGEFAYSDGMKAHGGNWDPDSLYAFLENPKAYVPGTKMSFAGLPKPEDRANIIAYLQSLGG
jgi:cytochrome c